MKHEIQDKNKNKNKNTKIARPMEASEKQQDSQNYMVRHYLRGAKKGCGIYVHCLKHV